MKASSDTFAGKGERTELDLELGSILQRIHRRWLQSGQDEELRLKATVPPEEMETVIIPIASKTVQMATDVAEEFTETVILSPVTHGTQVGAFTKSDEDVPETLVIAAGIKQEISPADDIAVEEETIVLRRNGTHTGQPMLNEEESLGETIVLPPRKQRVQRRGAR